MMNDFTALNAETETSAFAKFTTEEHAEYQAWLDEREQETLEEKQQRKLDAWRKWGEKMAFLRQIHEEIAPLIAARKAALE
jgi:hypothetical protein